MRHIPFMFLKLTVRGYSSTNSVDTLNLNSKKRWYYLKRLTRPLPLMVLLSAAVAYKWKILKKQFNEDIATEAKAWEVTCYKSIPLRIFSRSWGWFSNMEVPVSLRPTIYSLYANAFSCNMEEAESQDLTSYLSLADFFCRMLKEESRPVDSANCVVSPADGSVLNVGAVETNRVEQIKGVTYSLEAFLGHRSWHQTNLSKVAESEKQTEVATSLKDYKYSLLENKDNALYQYVVYLAPGDYHRFHSPVDWSLTFRRHFQGELLSVNPAIAKWIPDLFSLNERVVYIGRWKYGFFSMTAIGATNVGCIKVYCDKELKTNERKWRQGNIHRDFHFCKDNDSPLFVKKGELFGEFRMGSTIAILFEAPKDFEFNVKPGDKIRFGEAISSVLH